MIYDIIPGGIVEIKCPFSAKDFKIEEALAMNHLKSLRYVYDKNNVNHINTKNKYYYQLQGLLHVSRRQYCIFVMWSIHSHKIVIVMRDDQFWQSNMKFKLHRFYNECLLPEIVDSRLNINMEIRNPEFIKAAKLAKLSKKMKEGKITILIKDTTSNKETNVNANQFSGINVGNDGSEINELLSKVNNVIKTDFEVNNNNNNFANDFTESDFEINHNIETYVKNNKHNNQTNEYNNNDSDIEVTGVIEAPTSGKLILEFYDTFPLSTF